MGVEPFITQLQNLVPWNLAPSLQTHSSQAPKHTHQAPTIKTRGHFMAHSTAVNRDSNTGTTITLQGPHRENGLSFTSNANTPGRI
jgi:hypothetical protein